ncbi:MAG: Hsp20/alpha crystallin family protein [Bellilinea sp.]
MSLYLAHPYGRMMANRRMMHRMMNDEWSETPARVAFPIDVKDGEEAYEIFALLPGVSAEDLNIQIVNDTVTIQGEIKVDSDENESYIIRERPAGRFMRALRLPETVDSAKVDASLKDGVLSLYIPKAEEARPKTIKINAN